MLTFLLKYRFHIVCRAFQENYHSSNSPSKSPSNSNYVLQKRLRPFHVLLLFLCVCDFFHLLLSILCFSLQHLSTDYRNHVQCRLIGGREILDLER